MPASRGDGNYYCTVNSAGYTLVSGCNNPKGAALLTSCERFKILDPTVISVDKQQLIEKYFWTDEMLDMYDHVQELANGEYTVMPYDAGLVSKLKLNSVVNDCKELGRLQTAKHASG